MYGHQIRQRFAIEYAHRGNATQALEAVLGAERAGRMKPVTLRAKASTLLNDYRTVVLIEQEKFAMLERGERLPRFRKRTERTDLMNELTEKLKPTQQPVDPLQEIRGIKTILKQLARATKRRRKRY
ncbi:hypothetical protein NYR60_06505 [Actinobacillus genomosp. 2]|uniref:hypothetical protein n=1 Tax=Actinobacillus genomosp. 2 TaxID=230709 RepID=UPI0024412315|nr:hypothetical protein [Actinobacillus genomosp. 2]WGE31512.1 hypothetical protein NYR60_06505 [Actinobacillus genomosp. 2]